MKIARLSVKNFLGIKEALIEPRKVTILSGKNGQGKSSVLKAIEAVFKGAPFSVIHKGTERAELIAELEDIRVIRVITHKTSSVIVKTKEGFTRPAPQTYLDGLLGSFAFNPLAFLTADAKDRRNYLLRAMAVTVTREQIIQAAGGREVPVPAEGPALEQYADAYRLFYQSRTEVNRRLKQKQGAAAELQKKIPEGFEPEADLDKQLFDISVSRQEVGKEIASLEAEKRAADNAETTRKRLTGEQKELREKHIGPLLAKAKAITFTDEDLAQANEVVADLQAKLDAATKNRDHISGQIDARNSYLSTAESYEQDWKRNDATLRELPPSFDASRLDAAEAKAGELLAQFSQIEKKQAQMATFNEYDALREEIQNLEEEAGSLSALVETFGKELPAKALAEAKLPIQDLAIDGSSVTVRGIPIEDLSTSEQIAVTLSIARAMAKEIPLVCIDGVERLDDDMFSEFVKQAEGDGFQYFVTRVGVPREGELAVEGGKVVAG